MFIAQRSQVNRPFMLFYCTFLFVLVFFFFSVYDQQCCFVRLLTNKKVARELSSSLFFWSTINVSYGNNYFIVNNVCARPYSHTLPFSDYCCCCCLSTDCFQEAETVAKQDTGNCRSPSLTSGSSTLLPLFPYYALCNSCLLYTSRCV